MALATTARALLIGASAYARARRCVAFVAVAWPLAFAVPSRAVGEILVVLVALTTLAAAERLVRRCAHVQLSIAHAGMLAGTALAGLAGGFAAAAWVAAGVPVAAAIGLVLVWLLFSPVVPAVPHLVTWLSPRRARAGADARTVAIARAFLDRLDDAFATAYLKACMQPERLERLMSAQRLIASLRDRLPALDRVDVDAIGSTALAVALAPDDEDALANFERAARPLEPPVEAPLAVARGAAALAVALIRGYREISRGRARVCCYSPSCSRYAEAALTRHGLVRGLGLAAGRMVRCNPSAAGGYDPLESEGDDNELRVQDRQRSGRARRQVVQGRQLGRQDHGTDRNQAA